MGEQDSKPAVLSTTMWAGGVQIIAGLVLMVVGALRADQTELIGIGVGMLSTGAATIQGRATATTRIRGLIRSPQ